MERKTCPFCGSTAIEMREEDLYPYSYNPTTEHFAWCSHCEAAGPRARSEAAAIEHWNHREGDAS